MNTQNHKKTKKANKNETDYKPNVRRTVAEDVFLIICAMWVCDDSVVRTELSLWDPANSRNSSHK